MRLRKVTAVLSHTNTSAQSCPQTNGPSVISVPTSRRAEIQQVSHNGELCGPESTK
jgi:hypothetical protein